MDWSKIPDILAIVSLSCAFSSILRRNRTPAHRLWLLGWTMIGIHFVGLMIMGAPGPLGLAGSIVGVTALAAAGLCFMWATVPSENGVSCRRMAVVIFLTVSLYMVLAAVDHMPGWAFDLAAVLIAVGPLTVGIVYRNYAQHPLRWLTIGLHFALGAELLVLRHQTGKPDLGVDAILFIIYLGCCIYFWYSHQAGTTGSIITVGGFLVWAFVFILGPAQEYYLPNLHIENEVWNLPKYVVAIGMLMLLLEKQIERSQYLALHDDLTELANRRLFQDRLTGALERARRSGSSVALLQIDLDGFKSVNDTYGHHMGDLLLQYVAGILRARVRRSDTVARTGGDEFCVILEEAGRREAATAVAAMLERILSEPCTLAGERIRIGASIGVAIFPEDAKDSKELCIEADVRMYSSKQDRKEDTRATRNDRREPQPISR